MQPTLFTLGRVAKQAEANATMEVGGFSLEADIGYSGTRLLDGLPMQVQCFEIRSCWRKWSPSTKPGATEGRYWLCDALPTTFWVNNGKPSHWDCRKRSRTEALTEIWWPVSSLEDVGNWEKSLYPKYEIGQWVWCIFDYQANVWRVIDNYDNLVRFRLIAPMNGCDKARALVIGFPCFKCRSVSSSTGESESSLPASESSVSGESSSSAPVEPSVSVESSASSCSGGFVVSSSQPSDSTPSDSTPSQSSSAPSSSSVENCLETALPRGQITVYDPLGIVFNAFPGKCVAPACTTGWAKRCADSRRWEVVSYGGCCCGGEVATGSTVTLQSPALGATDLQTWVEYIDGCRCLPASVSGPSGSGESVSSSSGSSSSSLPSTSCSFTPAMAGLPEPPDNGQYVLSVNNGCLEWLPVAACDASSGV